ncbi:hypothetical protein BDV95DRAFT_521073 [Massariosphaeria phaeospora]|uniref:F-box domain-containing protein n=1 Tax=Massariosphaeria phaeospora TaxID=100035 RepID=A0A7C8M8G9_9PLEO|nr:hypothetical protein BDV95DRAFT_521073 [Massariosphaeria phaeospora]
MERQESPPHGRHLLSLVDELLLGIIDQIDTHETLCCLARTCSRLQNLTEPYIWRHLLVRRGSNARQVATALDNKTERTSFVQDLSIRYAFKDEDEDGIEKLGPLIRFMDKLRHLRIESPCPNNVDHRGGGVFHNWTKIDYTSLFEATVHPQGLPPALPMLQSLHLHGHGPDERKFTFGRTAIIFFHPTLRHITISCINFDAEISHANVPAEKLKSTPLQSLTLVECNVNVPFLDVVLSLPRALQELNIGERLFTFDDCRPSLDPQTRTSHPLFLTALNRQAGSLKHLEHIGGDVSCSTSLIVDAQGSAKLRNLAQLEYLQLGFESSLVHYIAHNGCPDSLRTLRLSDAALSHAHSYSHVQTVLRLATELVAKRMSNAIDLELGFAYNMFSDALNVVPRHSWGHSLWDDKTNRDAAYEIATALKVRGSRFRMFGQKFDSGNSYIPPYMFGEEEPTEVLVYDSDRFWTFGETSHQASDDETFGVGAPGGDRKPCVRCQQAGLHCVIGTGVSDATRDICLKCEVNGYTCVASAENSDAQ